MQRDSRVCFDAGGCSTPLKVTGHTVYSRKQVKLHARTAALRAPLGADGTMQHTRDRKAAFRFQMSAESAKLQQRGRS
jgi:hypothetical protein